MLCTVATKVPGSKVAPVWLQEAIIMHPLPSPDEPYEGSFAEIIVTVVLRCKPGTYIPKASDGDCDFAFIHYGQIHGLTDLSKSFDEGPLKWVNDLTPRTAFGNVKRGFIPSDGKIDVILEPLVTDMRFGVTSPVKSVPVETRVWKSFPTEDRAVESPFTLIQARPECKECKNKKNHCCLARIRFTTDNGVEEGRPGVKYPAYGPRYVAEELYAAFHKITDVQRRQRLQSTFDEAIFEKTYPPIYDLALVGADAGYRYGIIAGHKHQIIPPFFAGINGNPTAATRREELVYYFTPEPSDESFMVVALAEKLGGIPVERAKAIAEQVEKAKTRTPLDEKKKGKAKEFLKEIAVDLKDLDRINDRK